MLLSDFEPKGATAKAYDSYIDGAGIANRTLVLIDEDGTVAWTYESPSPGEFPGPEWSVRRTIEPGVTSTRTRRRGCEPSLSCTCNTSRCCR